MSVVERKLGKRVAELRRLAGLTQAQLAERLDLATETVSRLERGAAIPSLASIERAAKVLGVDLEELFRFRERQSPKDHAVERLLVTVRPRPAEDVEVVVDLATRVFQRWPTARAPAPGSRRSAQAKAPRRPPAVRQPRLPRR